MSDIQKIEGIISISHYVECPYCGYNHDDYHDADWWNENITDQMPGVEAYNDTYEPICKECKKKFIVEGFVY